MTETTSPATTSDYCEHGMHRNAFHCTGCANAATIDEPAAPADGHHFDRLRDDVPETCECGARFGNPGDFHIDVVKAAHLRAHGVDVIDVERVSVHDRALALSTVPGEADHDAAHASLVGRRAVFITCERDEIVGTLERPTRHSSGYMVIRLDDGHWGRADDEILLVRDTDDVVRVDTRSGSIRVAVPANVGPLGAFRGRAAAERCLASYDDVAPERTGAGVDRMTDIDGSGDWYVASITYPRTVRR